MVAGDDDGGILVEVQGFQTVEIVKEDVKAAHGLEKGGGLAHLYLLALVIHIVGGMGALEVDEGEGLLFL